MQRKLVIAFGSAALLAGCFGGGESTRRFENDVDFQIPPRKLGRILVREHANLVTIDIDAGPVGGDFACVSPMNRIVLEEMGECFRVGEIVDRNEVDCILAGAVLSRRTKHLPADSSKSIDAYTYCHSRFPMVAACRHERRLDRMSRS